MKARWLLALILVLPTASAGAVDATLTGGTVAAEGALFSAHPQAAYVDGFSGLRGFHLTAEVAHVQRFERKSIEVSSVQAVDSVNSPTPETYDLHDVDATLADDSPWSAGWLGVYDARGTLLSAEEPADVAWSPQASVTIGKEGVSSETKGPQPNLPYVHQQVEGPTLAYALQGRVRVAGDLVLKLEGLNLTLSARENQTTIVTGKANDPGPVPTLHETWLFLTFTNATLLLDTQQPLSAASPEVSVVSCSALDVDAAQGSVQSDGEEGKAQGPVRLVGRLGGVVRAQGDPGSAGSFVSVQGQATVGGVRFAPTAAEQGAGIVPVVAVLALGALLVAAAVLWARRRHAKDDLTLEQCMDLCERAIEQGAWGIALDWNGRALAMVPDHPRLLADRGTILESTGRIEEAAHAYRRAAAHGADGEGEILLARLLLRFDPSSEEAQGAIVSALRKSPEMAFEVEEEDEYRLLRGRPSVRQALRDARRATDGA